MHWIRAVDPGSVVEILPIPFTPTTSPPRTACDNAYRMNRHTPINKCRDLILRLMAGSLALLLSLGLTMTAAAQITSATAPADIGTTAGGPVRLRQPNVPSSDGASANKDGKSQAKAEAQAYQPGEFEVYVQSLAGMAGPQKVEVRRFGAELLTGTATSLAAADYSPLVPASYVLQAGDELVLTFWGSVDADLRLQVDRSGRVNVPRVGPIMVSGVRYGDLTDVISRRVAMVFKNFQISVSLFQQIGR